MLGGGVLIGVVRAAWHVVPWLQVHDPARVVWQFLFTVAARVVIAWLYSGTGGSVLAASLFHAVLNVSYSAFPNNGSFSAPAVLDPIMMLVAVAVTAVPTVWAREPRQQRWP